MLRSFVPLFANNRKKIQRTSCFLCIFVALRFFFDFGLLRKFLFFLFFTV